MTQIHYWSMLPIRTFVATRSKQCINLAAGLICGAAQVLGAEIFTKTQLDEALAVRTLADTCKDELPVKLTSEHDEIAELMNEGGLNAVSKAKGILKTAGVSDKCIEIFGFVCSKAQQSGVLQIIKDACHETWV